jgi:GTP-binding protein EngB required for normal cell division
MEANTRIGLVAFGEVGTGKSTLCNTLIGSNGKDFIESERTESQTLETIGKEGKFGSQDTFLIDTPGIGDAERKDAAHLVQMAKYIKENNLIRGFIMTINVHCPRLGDRERRLFELISSMYPGSPWFQHIAVVWSRCYTVMADQIEKWKPERKEGFVRFIEKYFGKEISKEQANSIPHYFVDSIEARQKDSPSHNELCYLLAWAGQLKTIKEELPTIKVKVGAPVVETRTREVRGGTWDDTWDERRGGLSGFFGGKRQRGRKYQNITTIYEQREKQEFTDGSVEYTDWREAKRESRQACIDSW